MNLSKVNRGAEKHSLCGKSRLPFTGLVAFVGWGKQMSSLVGRRSGIRLAMKGLVATQRNRFAPAHLAFPEVVPPNRRRTRNKIRQRLQIACANQRPFFRFAVWLCGIYGLRVTTAGAWNT